MYLKLMVFSLLLSVNSWAQSSGDNKDVAGYDPRRDIISDKYEAGPWLIYDCEKKHWTCVLETYYRDCEKERAEDQLNRKQALRCAPIGEFPTKKSCFQRQLYMVGQNYGTRFCVGDRWKEREVKF